MKSLALILPFLVFCASSALVRSPTSDRENGYFIRLKAFSEDVYGSLPADLEQDFALLAQVSQKMSLISDSALFARVSSSLTTGEVNRQSIYQARVKVISFLAQDLVSKFNEAGFTHDDFELFWITPCVFVKATSGQSALNAIASLPYVEEIVANDVLASIYDPVESFDTQFPTQEHYAWGLENMRVVDAWKQSQGEGIRVGIIDTGVRFTHHAIRGSYGGARANGVFYSWFDPKELQNDPWWCKPDHKCNPAVCCLEEPFDNVGHGSHVTGTIAGQKYNNGSSSVTIGVAPKAKWMAAKGCRDGNCLRYGLTKSAEWMICPSKLDGTDSNCNKGADIINNSWGGSGGDPFFSDIVEMWEAVGIIGVFANGNSGPECATAGSPGDMSSVLGVGASDQENRLAKFSGRGPGANLDNIPGGIFAYLKPDLTAPGYRILSVSYKNDKSLTTMSGTSMAAPHITGLVALMLSARRNRLGLDMKSEHDDLFSKIVSTTSKTVGEPHGWGGQPIPIPGFPPKKVCANVKYTEWPNMFYGNGLADARSAVQSMLQ